MAEARPEAFTLIIEPVKGCNLNCAYCYSDTSSGAVMGPKTLRITLEKSVRYAERSGFSTVHILWHGGEPLLAGLDFFRQAARIMAEISSGPRFVQFIQTNGLLLDDDFCRFFRDQEVQVGVSLDGPREVHDAMRTFADGRGTHSLVLEKLSLLNKHGVAVGLNAVGSKVSLAHDGGIYHYFKGLGYSFRVNPAIPAAVNTSVAAPYLFSKGEYGRFLCRLFDEWTGTEIQRVRVSPVDLYLRTLLRGEPYECQQLTSCTGSHLGVKPSGDAVLCSRFEAPILGNIHEMEIQQLVCAPFCQEIESRAEHLTECRRCRYWFACHGGCPHNALVFSRNHLAKDPFCPDYKLIFAHLERALQELHPQPPVNAPA